MCKFFKPRSTIRVIQFTKNFTLEELVFSDLAIRYKILNIPSTGQIVALKQLAVNILQPIRTHYGRAVLISSGYRCKELNTLVKGYKKSQHMLGEAADFVITKIKPKDIFLWIVLKSGLPFDVIVLEFNSWIHITFSYKARGKILIARHKGGKAVYTHYTKEEVAGLKL